MSDIEATLASANDSETARLLAERWYYRIEIAPGVWTAGERFDNIAITRSLLSRANLSGASVLDIGTMDGMVPILSCAAGATRVAAYDRLPNYREHIALVKKAYGYNFEYTCGISLAEFRAKHTGEDFDVVVFSGVLYHMFDPFAGLAIAASFVKPGGLLIFESSAVVRNDCALYFNEAGRFYPGTTYFQPTPDALDYFFRFFGLAAVDAEYLVHLIFPMPLIRLAVACRATFKTLPKPGDSWMDQSLTFFQDLSEVGLYRKRARAASGGNLAQGVNFSAADRSLAIDAATGTLNLARFLEIYPRFEVQPEMTELSLQFRASK